MWALLRCTFIVKNATRKKFDQTLFDQNDALGKLAVVRHLLLNGQCRTIVLNPARYGVDVLYTTAKAPRVEKSMEAEVKRRWTEGPFPYDTIQVLERKRKYFETGSSLLLLSADRQHYLVLSAYTILTSPVEGVYNKYSPSGKEQFFIVDAYRAKHYKFKQPLDWRRTPTCNTCKEGKFTVDGWGLLCQTCSKPVEME